MNVKTSKTSHSKSIAFDDEGNRYFSEKVINQMVSDIFERQEKIEKLEIKMHLVFEILKRDYLVNGMFEKFLETVNKGLE